MYSIRLELAVGTALDAERELLQYNVHCWQLSSGHVVFERDSDRTLALVVLNSIDGCCAYCVDTVS